ncbi:MAG TPA: carbon-nitrogen hydrolase family protein [Thermoleophilaceae bacterium]|nr:carbon-nitrogen hydrolase family protein [Thermoleophilaceae bacterium]
MGVDTADEFYVVERTFSADPSHVSIGLANIRAHVPDVEANKDKVLRVAKIFKERGVNFGVFPEFCLSGYFWDDERACREYMDKALTHKHHDWIDNELMPLFDDQFIGVILNNVTQGPDGKYFNSTFPVARGFDYRHEDNIYNKVFLPGIEKTYSESGRDDRLVVNSERGWGRFGFTTCYDYLFSDLLREYSLGDKVDGIVQLASWRAAATRDYAGMNVRTDAYYGQLWDKVMAANSATNQVWTFACNAVGTHGVSNVAFWGGSGVWAPSGMTLVQASHFNEELVIVHNLDIKGARADEHDEFDYALDFNEIYRPLENSRGFTRELG